uniref:BZIP domain-containing protein n=1 Tax=Tetraodon nigroviridis TaxID=99883 RepID=H3BZZ3_TETNG
AGDGHSDWMTEKVDLSSFVSTTESSPSSSLPPSPLEHDVKVPSDLEVMTSLLQEELAQLEDYFRSENAPTANKLEKPSKCDKGAAAMGSQSYYQFPYGSYGTSQSETSPVVVTLATVPSAGPKLRDRHRRSAELSVNHYSTLKTVSKNSLGTVKKTKATNVCPEGTAKRTSPAPSNRPWRMAPPPRSATVARRKQKKRDQNKTAAHRYRLRKRAELDSLEEELHCLEGQNRELRDKAESVEREIQYVKDLLIEVYKARSQRLKQD